MLILLAGFLFGFILQYANLNKYNTISGLAILEDLTIVKTMALAIGIGIILLSFEIGFGFASFHIKPLLLGGVIFGGLIFGIGMAILGYCPGTLAISLGEGSLDALIGIVGGLVGGLAFTIFKPSLADILGPNYGNISLNSLIGTNFTFYLISFIIGVLIIILSFWLNKKDKPRGNNWIYAGIALALLNPLLFLTTTTNRPIGASTAFPYAADILSNETQNNYFTTIESSGNWELQFLAGAFLAGLIISLIKKEFKIVLIHKNWKKYKGTSSVKRIIWSLIGGFILIFGARMAEGCTSGHILSGGMQLSISSLVFAVFTFIGLLATGKLFYKSY